MKLKHNKKRNTAFLFEALVREYTRAAIRKDQEVMKECRNILRDYFSSNTVLGKELSLYRSLYETVGLSKPAAEKLISEVRSTYKHMISENQKEIFAEQSAVIKKINKNVSTNVFSNFVPQYKNLATVYQIFNGELAPEKRILLEEFISDSISSTPTKKNISAKDPVDNLVLKNFLKKFNDKYGDALFEEQSKLLSRYVLSFSDNGLAFKSYLHEELGRLKGAVSEGTKKDEIANDSDMIEKTQRVMTILENFANKKMTNNGLEQVLKIQALVREINS